MQQTFYIDQEEEISSIVERLRKSVSVDNYLVIPKRALFLQSIVNLKLVKLEADKLKKNIVIVTQDELGRGLAEKSGIAVQASVDEDDAGSGKHMAVRETSHEDVLDMGGAQYDEYDNYDERKKRLAMMGSRDYYGSRHSEEQRIPVNSVDKNRISESSQKTSSVISHGSAQDGRAQFRQKFSTERDDASYFDESWLKQARMNEKSVRGSKGRIDPRKEKSIEKMFNHQENQKKQHNIPQIRTGRKTKKIIYAFIAFCVVFFSAVAAYVFIPTATVKVVLKEVDKKADIKLVASNGLQNGGNIALRIASKEEAITISYPATGKGKAIAQTKARGTVMIYNEFSNSPQQLLETTRLEDSQGHIFRIVKTVTVPGMSGDEGQAVAGTVQVEVVADQSGEGYNIPPSTFTIPGFKDGPKYSKFYAKSAATMVGGKTDASVGSLITQQDIDAAKEKAEKELHEKLNDAIKGGLQNGEMLLPEMMQFSVIQSASARKVGEEAQQFEYMVKGSLVALVFSESEVLNDITDEIMKDYGKNSLDVTSIDVSYSQVSPDFEGKKATFSANGELRGTYKFNQDAFRSEIVGKSIGQVAELAKKMNGIKNIEIELFPSFMTHLPQFPNNVTVAVE